MLTVGEHAIGSINVTSGELAVSDPCYLENTLYAVRYVKKAKVGVWNAEVEVEDQGVWGDRVSVLRVATNGSGYKESFEGYAGVDSGQMSILDASLIPLWGGDDRPPMLGSEFRELCREHIGEFNYLGVSHETMEDRAGCVQDKIAVSSSGYGDGQYSIYVWRDENDEAVRVEVRFIEEEDEDDDQWADDEEETDDEEDEEGS